MMRLADGGLSVEHVRLAVVPRTDQGQRRGFQSWEGDNYIVRQYGAVRGTYPSVEKLREDWPELAILTVTTE
jgi:hypothetical protein